MSGLESALCTCPALLLAIASLRMKCKIYMQFTNVYHARACTGMCGLCVNMCAVGSISSSDLQLRTVPCKPHQKGQPGRSRDRRGCAHS
ncbi:hypothetical protein BCR44DRAFT_335999 [Catenaria anguillulae PL171]|uniref:4Fe-4S ferredoxin-type domain-containing protein n=1 Tax=Catenaria anguillulae PL171 TaxID=765915 RepID=A0A1Y2HJ55_9FUNG|nr:hypothetical protein BCR44DRAFT_1148970 [Catenaria anguillulae PL171]ORZ36089.1 hypothetical protein BCR44DRAFT_335999 [Catenaria anguillulae PL171]